MSEVNIHLKTPGAQQAQQALGKTAGAARKLGDDAHEGGQKGAAGMDGLGKKANTAASGIKKVATAITSYVANIAGVAAIIAGITAAIRANQQAVEEHARIAEQQQRKLTTLQYLGGFFKENPNLRKEVETYAEYGRRPFEEVAGAWYNLRSKSAALSTKQRRGILHEALEMGRTSPDAPLDTLVDMFSLYAKKTGQKDMNLVQNVLQQSVTEAGGGMSDVARYMTRFLPIGMSGGLTGPQAAGLWSYATTQTSDAAVATTGLQALFMGLQGKGTPESQKILEGAGITQDMGFFGKMGVLSHGMRTGRFGLAQAEQLAGREGASILLDLLKDPTAMMQTISNVTGAARGDIDITGDMITELIGQDERARLEEDIRLQEIRLAGVKSDTRGLRSMKAKRALLAYETKLRETGDYSESDIAVMTRSAWLGLAVEHEFRDTFRLGDPDYSQVQGLLHGQIFPDAGKTTEVHYHNDLNLNPRVANDPANREAGETRTGDL